MFGGHVGDGFPFYGPEQFVKNMENMGHGKVMINHDKPCTLIQPLSCSILPRLRYIGRIMQKMDCTNPELVICWKWWTGKPYLSGRWTHTTYGDLRRPTVTYGDQLGNGWPSPDEFREFEVVAPGLEGSGDSCATGGCWTWTNHATNINQQNLWFAIFLAWFLSSTTVKKHWVQMIKNSLWIFV